MSKKEMVLAHGLIIMSLPFLCGGYRNCHAAVHQELLVRNDVSCGWQSGFWIDGLDGPGVLALQVYDDGGGEALYAGGLFTSASGVLMSNIARWDGTQWSALSGPSGTGTDDKVNALAVWDDGDGPALYAGGEFTYAGGELAYTLARWDGEAWSGINGLIYSYWPEVWALAVYDDGNGPALYIGGIFDVADGVTVNNIARWDGATWSALAGPSGTGTDGTVYEMAVFDDGDGAKLYVAGYFETAGGVTVNRIARWDGSTWSPLAGDATGADSFVHSLAVFDEGSGAALYVGGGFTTAGGVTVNGIARWDGVSWSPLFGPSGIGVATPEVYSLAVYDDGSGSALYAGGSFSLAGGLVSRYLARWDGTTWSPVDARGLNDDVYHLAVYDDGSGQSLYLGGVFSVAGEVPANGVVAWDGANWSGLNTDGDPGNGTDGSVMVLLQHDDGSGQALFAGGYFDYAGGVRVNHIARWDGSTWWPLSGPYDTGMSNAPVALAEYDDGGGTALFAGGSMEYAGGLLANSIAHWDGSTWSPLTGSYGTGVYGKVQALAVYDDGNDELLYAGGSFSSAGGIPVSNIATWDGNEWSPLYGIAGSGTDATVNALVVYDDGGGPALYAGGAFTTADSVLVNHIARWDGVTWSPLVGASGIGTDGPVNALTVLTGDGGPALYVGGTYITAGGVTVNHISRWDGVTWSSLTGASGIGVDDAVLSLAAAGTVGNMALFVGGDFSNAGGVTVNHIAGWDGSDWSPLSGASEVGIDGHVDALAVFDEFSGAALFAGGWFHTAGGFISAGIGRWSCVPWPIFSDGFEQGDTSAWSVTVNQ